MGGEIFRLKNGDAAHKERFRQIQSTRKSLTGRDLDLRARSAADGEAAFIIEPTVSGQHPSDWLSCRALACRKPSC